MGICLFSAILRINQCKNANLIIKWIISCSSIRHYTVFQWFKTLLLFLSVSSSISSSSHHIHAAVVQWPHRLGLTPDRGRLRLLGQLQDEGRSPTETERHIQITSPLTCHTHTHTPFRNAKKETHVRWHWSCFLIQRKSSQKFIYKAKNIGVCLRGLLSDIWHLPSFHPRFR